MTQHKLRELVKASNPVYTPARLLPQDEDVRTLFLEVMNRTANPQASTDLLDTTVERRREMETQEKQLRVAPKPTPRSERRRRLVYGLTAALVALIVGSVVWAVVLNDPEPDVAPQPGPTPTTIVDTTPTTVPEGSEPVPLSNLEELLTADGRFTTYLELWDVVATAPAGGGPPAFDFLGRLLRQSGTMTLFVPTDEAFAALPAGYLDDLKTTFLNPQDRPGCAGCVQDARLQGLLGYLSLPVRIGSLELASRGRSIAVDGTSFVTNQSSDFRLTVGVDADGNTVLGGTGGPNSVVIPGEVATIIEADLEASNGIVHVIDTVLIPPNPLAGWDVASSFG